MAKYIDVEKKIEEMNMKIESISRLIENRPYDEEAKLMLREFKYCRNELIKTSTADVVEVKHGEWKHTVEKGNVYNHHFFNCSLCGASAFTSGYEKYCHECGAKMDGGNAE